MEEDFQYKYTQNSCAGQVFPFTCSWNVFWRISNFFLYIKIGNKCAIMITVFCFYIVSELCLTYSVSRKITAVWRKSVYLYVLYVFDEKLKMSLYDPAPSPPPPTTNLQSISSLSSVVTKPMSLSFTACTYKTKLSAENYKRSKNVIFLLRKHVSFPAQIFQFSLCCNNLKDPLGDLILYRLNIIYLLMVQITYCYIMFRL